MKKIFSISDQSTKAIFWKPKQVFMYKLIFFVISIKDLYIMILHAFIFMIKIFRDGYNNYKIWYIFIDGPIRK